jgi:hypothetical protein
MTPNYDNFEDHRIKHLEMTQAVIGRLASNSFLIKGWAVTVAGVFFGFAVNQSDPALARVSLATTGLFWLLDTYFLRAERLFRVLHDRVRTCAEDVEPFFMGATAPWFVKEVKAESNTQSSKAASWLKTFGSLTLVLLYGGLVASALIVASAIGKG